MQSRMTIKYTSYGDIEKTTIYQILKYFTTPRKGVLFRLDFDKENETGWDEEDIYISSLSISKLEGFKSNEKYSKEYYVTFMCDNKEQKYLLKLLFAITQHGDPGHTFGITFANKHLGWDGDGSDRIDEINFIDKWKKKEYYEYIDNLPEKVLNYNRAYKAIFQEMRNIPTDNPLWNGDGHKKFAGKIAKKYSEFQYNKFLEIKGKIETKK